MKKALVLGAAALAALAVVPNPASAGEVKLGGYYMFRMQDTDPTVIKDASGTDDQQYWKHRLQLKMDMIASPKTHAHMVFRAFDSTLEGADSGLLSATTVTNSARAADAAQWDIRQGWLETEAWTVGLKVGFMPISLNDRILVNDDTTGFATVMLSKSFGDITLVGADVRVRESDIGVSGASAISATGVVTSAVAGGSGFAASAPTIAGSNKDDEDLYVLSLLGKANNINYQLTSAYFYGGKGGFISNNVSASDDWWLAATAGGDFGLVNATGTVIWERGLEDSDVGLTATGGETALSRELRKGGFLGAVRLDGKTGFGGWQGYGFYSSPNFTNVTPQNQVWSDTWDQGGPGNVKMMRIFAQSNNGLSNVSQNMWGLGAGLIFNAQGWKINPMLDYAQVSDKEPLGGTQVLYDRAWGGSLMLSTEIDKGTTLLLGGTAIRPHDNAVVVGAAPGVAGGPSSTMHTVQAAVKMAF